MTEHRMQANYSLAIEVLERLAETAERTGFKKSTLVEQGIELRLAELEVAEPTE